MTKVEHTDAIEQAKFLALAPDQQLLQIWLNGRETNGSVAEVTREISAIKPMVERHDFWFRVAAVVVAALVAIGPWVFWALG